ncbi:MAG: TolC family protein [Methylococcales bacterium]|nr:TolC family protein [Methylococcales bacterium]
MDKLFFSAILAGGRKPVCRRLLIAVLIGFSPFSAAGGEELTLTAEQAIKLFYERNLDLLAARYNIENYQAREIIAAAIPNPTVTVEILEISKNSGQNSTAQGCQFQQGVPGNANCGPAEYYTFNQLIEMAGRRGLRMESSAIAAQAAESDFRDAVRIFSNMVRDAYYGLLQAQKVRWLAREIADHYSEIVHASGLRLKAGDIAESEYMRINVEALQAQTDLENAKAGVEQARSNLAKVLNWPDNSMQFAADEGWPQLREIGWNLSREALSNQALSQRPDLLADRQRADHAEKELMLAARLNYPDVSINGGFARDPGNTVLNSAFIGVSAPLPLFYQHQGELRQAQANLDKMRLLAEQTALNVRNDIVGSLAAWQSADHVVEIYESKLIGRARSIRERIELAYDRGAVGVMALIDAQREYKTVMLGYYTAKINRINAYYDLSKALAIEPDADSTQQPADRQAGKEPVTVEMGK